jgi:hypothetical protein
MLNKGRILIGIATEPLNERDREFARMQCNDPGNLFIGLADNDGSARFTSFAVREGFQRHMIEVFQIATGVQWSSCFDFRRKPQLFAYGDQGTRPAR